MTHAESLTPNHAGLVPSSCPGELALKGRFVDNNWDGHGWHTRTVDVYRCKECGWIVSMEGRHALNAYPGEKKA